MATVGRSRKPMLPKDRYQNALANQQKSQALAGVGAQKDKLRYEAAKKAQGGSPMTRLVDKGMALNPGGKLKMEKNLAGKTKGWAKKVKTPRPMTPEPGTRTTLPVAGPVPRPMAPSPTGQAPGKLAPAPRVGRKRPKPTTFKPVPVEFKKNKLRGKVEQAPKKYRGKPAKGTPEGFKNFGQKRKLEVAKRNSYKRKLKKAQKEVKAL